MAMIDPSRTTSLVGSDIGHGYSKWSGAAVGSDGSNIYGIPSCARRVMKFNTVDNSRLLIGPDLGNHGDKWSGGTNDGEGTVYCAPNCSNQILKIDTRSNIVTLLDVVLPESGRFKWSSGSLALDGCIYFAPASARRMLKLDPSNDSVSSVGDDLGNGFNKFVGVMAGMDGCLYGIPCFTKRIFKYDPKRGTTSFIENGDEDEDSMEGFMYCGGNGVLGRDGHIYASQDDGRLLKIDTTNNSFSSVGISNKSNSRGYGGWGDAILGIDGCIYCMPYNASHTLKYDPESGISCEIGNDLGNGLEKWYGGALALNGIIYCIPYNANRILTIHPFKEFAMTLADNVERYPEKLGLLFQHNDVINTKNGANEPSTRFQSSVAKYGPLRIFHVLDKCIPLGTDMCVSGTNTNTYSLPSFMVAASCDNSAVSVVYHFLRKDPSVCCTVRDSFVRPGSPL